MTVSSTTRKAGPYSGNGSTTSFPFSFKVYTKNDIAVYKTDSLGVITTLVVDSDYSVSINSNQDVSPGGTVTYPISGTILPSGSTLTIAGNLAYAQTTQLPSGGAYNATNVEAALDRLTILAQQLLEAQSRAVSVPVSSTTTPDQLVNSLISSASTATTAAASATAAWQAFQGQYYGAYSSDPSADPLGNAPGQGDVYYSTSLQRLRVYGSGGWSDASVVTPMSLSNQTLSGTGAQTVFTLSTAPAYQNACEVFISGVAQVPGTDFTVTGSPLTTLTFTSAPPAGTNNIFVRSVSSYAGGVPTDGSVTTAKVAGQSITNAKLAFDGGAFQFRNKLTNGDLSVWQRGTSFTTYAGAAAYTADRWFVYTLNGSVTATRSTDVPTDSGLPYSVKVQRPAGDTGTNPILYGQVLESIDAAALAGKTVTLSFWIKKGANYTAGLMNPFLYFGTGVDQGLVFMLTSTWTGQSNTYGYEAATSSWARQSTQFTVPSGTTEIGIALSRNCSGTAGADDSLYFAGIQLEIGAEPATAFEFSPYQVQLARCQRYYLQQNYIALNGDVIAPFPVTMRTTPSVTTTAGTANTPNPACFRLNHSATATVTITAYAEL